MSRDGMVIVVSAPSGTGKGAIIRDVLKRAPEIHYSVSATTRSPRKGEVPGKDYLYLTRSQFEDGIREGNFLEWDQYLGEYYGTSRDMVERAMTQGFDVMLEITVAGALEVRRRLPESVMIFVVPPSMKELERRIRSRGTEEPEIIEKRLNNAWNELRHMDRYDYIVVNDKLEDAVEKVLGIIQAERLKYRRNRNILDKMEDKNDI